MAVLTGGTVISEELGLKLRTPTLKDLGKAKKVEAAKENTPSSTARGDKKLIEGRIKQIRVQIEEATSDYDKEKAAGARGEARWRRALVKVALRPRSR